MPERERYLTDPHHINELATHLPTGWSIHDPLANLGIVYFVHPIVDESIQKQAFNAVDDLLQMEEDIHGRGYSVGMEMPGDESETKPTILIGASYPLHNSLIKLLETAGEIIIEMQIESISTNDDDFEG